WDGWVHERDIALPQGLSTVEEPDEVLACLRYVAALSPAFALTRDGGRSGTMVITATHPQATVTVTVGDDVHVSSTAAEVSTRLQGRAVDLVEMLSTRMPLEVTVEPGELWFFEGLATVFDTEVDLATTD
ncbi:MAG: hypothetical protein JWM40_1132, partial [Frankiales bacterium]|nr:hypothetical protein [Frankiales bacterium]